MSAFHGLQPDPSAIGRLSKPPFALLPDPAALFRQRAERLEVLAAENPLGPYLRFLAGICAAQAEVAAGLPPPDPLPAGQVERARDGRMPPLDRHALARDAALPGLVTRFLDRLAPSTMPEPAAAAIAALREAGPEALGAMLEAVAEDSLPVEQLPEHILLAAALQVAMAQRAATLPAERLVPIETGVCPACGGPPAASLVTGRPGAEGARYAACAACGTQWNEVRIKCLACGSTQGVGYKEVEPAAGSDEAATVKAETCDACRSWVKIFYQNLNPALEPIADDVASLGLDLMMRETAYRRAGFDPFLIGY